MRWIIVGLCTVFAGCASHEAPPDTAKTAPSSTDADAAAAPALARIVTDTLVRAQPTVEPLIPRDAVYVVGFDTATLMRSDPAQIVWRKFLSSGDRQAGRRIEDLLDCDLAPEQIDEITLAGTNSQLALTITGEGIGDPKLYRCAAQRARERGESDSLQVVEANGYTQLIGDDDEVAVLASPNAVVMATGEWGRALPARFSGVQPPRLREPSEGLSALLDEADKEAPLWWVASLPAEATSMIGPLDAMTGTVSADKRLEMNVWLQAPSNRDAQEALSKIETQFAPMKSVLASSYPAGIVESIVFRAEEDRVKLQMSASSADLETLMSTLGH